MKADKFVLVTGGAQRIGRSMALAIARSGRNVAIHYWQSQKEAESVRAEIEALGRKVLLLQADFSQPEQVQGVISRVLDHGTLVGLINNASIFEKIDWQKCSLDDWNRHMMVNLTVPFLLSQAFARALPSGEPGRIINMMDWRVFRPRSDYLPYSISKSGLAALTHSLAASFAPQITVNGLALGAVIAPVDGSEDESILDLVPSARRISLEEVNETLLFLLNGPATVTGEILYLDGGRHLI
ncbi:MAG TPA: SDR family oxidoreductase [Treponema sp.]|nr:SDR family oxidoreductase [Treponema sp.]